MKKRLLIICSIIGVLLAGFQFPIYAETTTPDYSSSTSIITSADLDQYFYDNYELLPYIQSDGNQYINTNISGSSNLKINISFSDLDTSLENKYIFGSRITNYNNEYAIRYFRFGDDYNFRFVSAEYSYDNSFDPYRIYNLGFDKNKVVISGSNVYEFNSSDEFSSNLNLYLFGCNTNGTADNFSSYKLYKFSIYDYSANEGEGALVRDYYPARSKSGGIIGLYDAVTKTFVTTSGSVPFASPTGDPVNLSLGANITQFLSGSLSWIGAIFEGINEMPIIWVFIAIALAGVMFRWGRRIVHL